MKHEIITCDKCGIVTEEWDSIERKSVGPGHGGLGMDKRIGGWVEVEYHLCIPCLDVIKELLEGEGGLTKKEWK